MAKTAETVKATYKQGRAKKNGDSYNANHNTLEATRKQQPHIDQSRLGDNLYMRFESDGKITKIRGGTGGFNATKHEKKIYEQKCGEGLEARNERYRKSRHPERCRTVAQVYQDPKTAPLESIWQIGNMHSNLSKEKRRGALTQAFNEAFAKMKELCGDNMVPLDLALHMDEKVGHIHFRILLGAEDEYGHFVPNQTKALEAMGFDRPDPTKPRSRYNNALISFTDTMREIFYQACERQGIHIDREVTSASRRQIEILEYKCEQFRRENMTLEQMKAQHAQEAREAAERAKAAERELNTTKSRIKALEASQAALEAKNKHLSDKNDQIEKRLSEVVAEGRAIVAENAQLRKENRQLKIEKNDLTVQVGQLAAEIGLLRVQQRQAEQDRDIAIAEKKAAVEKMRSIEKYQEGLYRSQQSRKVRTYGTLPAQEEKRNPITGKVTQEARPACTIVATEDFERQGHQAAYHASIMYNQNVIDEVEQAIAGDDVFVEQRNLIEQKQRKINELNIELDKKQQQIDDHRAFLEEKGLEAEFDAPKPEQYHSHHHRR